MLDQADRSREADPEVIGVRGFEGVDKIEVVLQVLPDARQLMDQLDAAGRDMLWSPNARKLQELRRTKGPGGKNDLTPGLQGKLGSAPSKKHTDGPLVLEQDARGS